jgi:site-specific recombinase XerD
MPGRSQVGPHEILLRVDPGRMRLGWPVGLRDGALLALLAAGFTPREVSRLRASAVTMTRGKLLVTVKRESVTWIALLPSDLGGWLLAWLTERRLWTERLPVIHGPQGRPLQPNRIEKILERYRRNGRARGCE